MKTINYDKFTELTNSETILSELTIERKVMNGQIA